VTVAELRRWKKQQAAEHLQAGPEWQDHGFAFTTEVGTPLGNQHAPGVGAVVARC